MLIISSSSHIDSMKKGWNFNSETKIVSLIKLAQMNLSVKMNILGMCSYWKAVTSLQGLIFSWIFIRYVFLYTSRRPMWNKRLSKTSEKKWFSGLISLYVLNKVKTEGGTVSTFHLRKMGKIHFPISFAFYIPFWN